MTKKLDGVYVPRQHMPNQEICQTNKLTNNISRNTKNIKNLVIQFYFKHVFD